ncbi:hypothetical protein HZB00_01390 [Candidatus Woesearchaeota archaeon]|nr:hypothetical protein [Candidatus Woesearchaeota archaeon]
MAEETAVVLNERYETRLKGMNRGLGVLGGITLAAIAGLSYVACQRYGQITSNPYRSEVAQYQQIKSAKGMLEQVQVKGETLEQTVQSLQKELEKREGVIRKSEEYNDEKNMPRSYFIILFGSGALCVTTVLGLLRSFKYAKRNRIDHPFLEE